MVSPIIVAEMSINHLGMTNILKKMILAARDAGANFVKLKMKDVKNYYPENGKRWRNFDFKNYRMSLEFTSSEINEIDKFCDDNGVKWFCTIHDEYALDTIKYFEPPFYKIASMDADNAELLDKVIEIAKEDEKPIVLSVGGKDSEFLDDAVLKIKQADIFAYLLHTVSIYPTPHGKSNINYILDLKNRYEDDKIKIGYSGHEKGFAPTIMATMFGAHMIERHFTLSRNLNIHHIDCALTPSEFASMVSNINIVNEEIKIPPVEYFEEELKFLKEQNYA